MAQQSIGMATGAGDGVVGGYPTSRMTAMETKTLSDGLLQTGNRLGMTGNGTGTLTIADGAAVVGGYFYENTASTAITVSSLANATYTVAILVNGTAGAMTVSAAEGGTTVPAYTVRACVATAAQLSGKTYLTLGTVQISGAAITASGIVPTYAAYGTTTMVPLQLYATMAGGSATLTAINTSYDITGYSSPTTTADAVLTADNSTGTITARRTGLYSVTVYGIFSSGTTGNRVLAIAVDGTNYLSTRAASSGTATHTVTVCALVPLTAGQVVKATCQTSLASQSIASAILTVAWA